MQQTADINAKIEVFFLRQERKQKKNEIEMWFLRLNKFLKKRKCQMMI